MFYTFTITIQGSGDTPEEAWRDATEAFSLDPGTMPEEFSEVEDDSEDDCSDKTDFGTCDNCKEETKIETVILCEECQQSQQLCSNCSQESFIYCWNCYSIIDLD